MPGIEFLENGRTGGNEMRRCPDEVAGEGDDIQVQLVHRSDIPFQLGLLHEITHVDIGQSHEAQAV